MCIRDRVYAVMAAVLGTVFLRPAMSLFFTGDISAVMPWARTYMNICVVFFVPLGAIFVYRNVMQGCGYEMCIRDSHMTVMEI